ncbi:MAG TPA: hypothetical protein VFK32_03435 [Tepidiformaceae bacterium]|nr:hypothetical protein [Tepidiformaceae bacterium]
MAEHPASCDHRWRYFVNIQSQAVRQRRCERCGTRSAFETAMNVHIPDPAPAEKQLA